MPFREDPVNLERLITAPRQIEEIEKDYGFGVDCDDFVILAGALARSIGVPVRIVLIGEHAPDLYSHIYLEMFCRDRGQWVPVDPAIMHPSLGFAYPSPAAKWIETFHTSDEFSGPWPRQETIELSGGLGGIGGRAGRRVRAVLQGLGQLEASTTLELGPGAGENELALEILQPEAEREEPEPLELEEEPYLEIGGDAGMEVEPGIGIDIDQEDGSGVDIDTGGEDGGLNLCMDPESDDPWCEGVATDEENGDEWDIDIDEDYIGDAIEAGTEDDVGGINIGFEDEEDVEDPGYDLDMSQAIPEDEPDRETWIDVASGSDAVQIPEEMLRLLAAELQPREITDRDTVSLFSALMIMSLVVIDHELRSMDRVRIKATQQALSGYMKTQDLSGLIDWLRSNIPPVDWALKQVQSVFGLIERILGHKIGGFVNGVVKLAISNIAQQQLGPLGRYFADVLLYELDGGIDWLELQWDRISLMIGPIIKGLSGGDAASLDIDPKLVEAFQRDVEAAQQAVSSFMKEYRDNFEEQLETLQGKYEEARRQAEEAYRSGLVTATEAWEQMQDLRDTAQRRMAAWREHAERELANIKDEFGGLLDPQDWLEEQTRLIREQADQAIGLEYLDDHLRTQELLAELEEQVNLGYITPRDAFAKLDQFERDLTAATQARIESIEQQFDQAVKEAERIQREIKAQAAKLRGRLTGLLRQAFYETSDVRLFLQPEFIKEQIRKAATNAMIEYTSLVGMPGLSGLADVFWDTERVHLFDVMRERGIDVAAVKAAAIQYELQAVMDIEISVVKAQFGEEALVAMARLDLGGGEIDEEMAATYRKMLEELWGRGIADMDGVRTGTRIREDAAKNFSDARKGKFGEGLDQVLDPDDRGSQSDYPPPLGEESEELISAGNTGLLPAGGRASFWERNKTLITVGGIAAAAAGAVIIGRRL